MVRKKRGIIVNLSSASCILPICTFQTYGATKSFVDYFSQALSYEYEDKGIIIQVSLFQKFTIRAKNHPAKMTLALAESRF